MKKIVIEFFDNGAGGEGLRIEAPDEQPSAMDMLLCSALIMDSVIESYNPPKTYENMIKMSISIIAKIKEMTDKQQENDDDVAQPTEPGLN